MHVKSEDGLVTRKLELWGVVRCPPHWCWEPLVMAEPFLHPQEFVTLKCVELLKKKIDLKNAPTLDYGKMAQ